MASKKPSPPSKSGPPRRPRKTTSLANGRTPGLGPSRCSTNTRQKNRGDPHADQAQLERAIRAATKFQKTFANWSAAKRQTHLLKAHDLLRERRTEFVKLLIKEAGKPLTTPKMKSTAAF